MPAVGHKRLLFCPMVGDVTTLSFVEMLEREIGIKVELAPLGR